MANTAHNMMPLGGSTLPASIDEPIYVDDLSDMPIGVIGGDYSPNGESHVVAALSHDRRWWETVLHYSYRNVSRGNWQVVEENDGTRAVEQTIRIEKVAPLLSTVENRWRDVAIEMDVRPLSADGQRGVAFRFCHGRKYYAVMFQEGRAQIVRRVNDTTTVLSEAPLKLDPDRYARVRIECRGFNFDLLVDGAPVLDALDLEGDRISQGGVGLTATGPTRYRRLTVYAIAGAPVPETATESAPRVHRCAWPVPRLWKKIATPGWGTARAVRFGDIDGDGNPEIVLGRRTDRLGKDNFSIISSLTAVSLEGERLWQTGTPDINTRLITSDLPFQIHDLDGDGKQELIYCRDWELIVADGATGVPKRSMALPLHPERPKDGLHRVLADSLHFCDLTGSGRPDCILVKDRYRNAWALGPNLEVLWHVSATTGHYPDSRSVKSTRKDLILLGYTLLDSNGTVLWKLELPDHADSVALVDLHLNGADSGVVPCAVIAGSDAGFVISDMEGRIRAQYPLGHTQCLCIGHLLADSEEMQIMANTFWGAVGITALFDETGKLMRDFLPMPYGSLLHPVNWVPRAESKVPNDLVLLSTHPRQGGCMDGLGNRMIMFPDDGHPVTCCEARDIDGDGIDEVITWNQDEIWIYKVDVAGRIPENYPKRGPWYNDSNYVAHAPVCGSM